MFRVERFAATHAHRLVYRRWEIVYTTVDLLAAICFVVGSALFFDEATVYAATWLFLVGSVFFALRPMARFARELHLARLPLPEDDPAAKAGERP